MINLAGMLSLKNVLGLTALMAFAMLNPGCKKGTTTNNNDMNEFMVKKKVVIKATPSEVWDALTNPEKTKEYFFNCKVFSDWKVGSPITFKGRIFLIKKIEMSGTIVQIEPEKLLKYTLHNEGNPPSMSTVTDELSYENGQTTLTITDDVGKGEGAQERFEKSEKGWDKVLEGLKELVEKDK